MTELVQEMMASWLHSLLLILAMHKLPRKFCEDLLFIMQ